MCHMHIAHTALLYMLHYTPMEAIIMLLVSSRALSWTKLHAPTPQCFGDAIHPVLRSGSGLVHKTIV